jgi:hypothetical protein
MPKRVSHTLDEGNPPFVVESEPHPAELSQPIIPANCTEQEAEQIR